ncbi:vasopressin V1b receptor-like [Saccostrea cucullata]|uniref:vasopressin V1b receptor-like n=1 Tax=Saccostrea cuccullata TaxID=36930 RepID=UPI002ECFD98C
MNGTLSTLNKSASWSTTVLQEHGSSNLTNGITATIVLLVILMVVGILGNIHVLVVFGLHFQKSSTYVTFVFALAVINFLMCSIEIPFEILDLLYPYGLFNAWLCKFFRSSNATLSMSSVFILLLISIDRYKRVCSPLKIQWSIKKSRILIAITVFGAFVLSVPVVFIFGLHTTEISSGELVQKCFFDDKVKGSMYPLLYLVFLQIATVVSIGILAFTYISIGLTIRKHARKRAKMTYYAKDPKEKRLNIGNSKCCGNHSANLKTDIVNSGQVFVIGLNYRNQKLTNDWVQKVSTSNTSVSDIIISVKNKIKTKSAEKGKQQGENDIFKRAVSTEHDQAKKNSKVFFLVTLVFIVMYTPYMILGVFLAVEEDFRENMNDVEITFYRLAMRFVYINDVVNCFIYGILDHRFKTCVFRFYKRIFTLCKS